LANFNVGSGWGRDRARAGAGKNEEEDAVLVAEEDVAEAEDAEHKPAVSAA
jgi:hypothetical protein